MSSDAFTFRVLAGFHVEAKLNTSLRPLKTTLTVFCSGKSIYYMSLQHFFFLRLGNRGANLSGSPSHAVLRLPG